MNITTLGIDIAKNVFQLHGIDNNGKTIGSSVNSVENQTPVFAALH